MKKTPDKYPPGTRVYIAGPMTGLPEHNYPAFDAMAINLRLDYDFVVYNPTDNFGGQTKLPRHEYMRIDIGHLLQAQMVVVLSGWRMSSGAILEVDIARELNLPVCTFDCYTGLKEIPNE